VNDTKEKPIKIIEIIGPAGAGKSSLGQLLKISDKIKIISSAPNFWLINDIPFFVKNTFLSLPSSIRFLSMHDDKRFNIKQFIWVVILNGWSNRLTRYAKKFSTIFILDEGPIYLMTFLYVYGSNVFKNHVSNLWWKHIFRDYANTFDIVVWLDAPNSVLVSRIRDRDKPHGVKKKTDLDAFNYLDNLRQAYERMISGMTTEAPELLVMRFDTNQETLDEISKKIVAFF
jgi:deoxyadenosine/deoxycytidine kinase